MKHPVRSCILLTEVT